MTDAALPPAPTAGTPAPAATTSGSVAPAAPVSAEGGVLPDFALILGGMEGGDKPTPSEPSIARATVVLPKPPLVEAENLPLPSSIMPPQDSPMPLATVATEVPKAAKTQPDAATDTDDENTEPPSDADEPVALFTPSIQPALAAPTPPPAQHQPAVAPPPPGDLSASPETPSRITQIASRRQDTPAATPSLVDAKEPRTSSQPAHMPSSSEQQNDTTATPSPTLALPDQPTTPSAPARAATQIISTAPGRFGEELGIAIARHVSRGEGGAAETLCLRLDPPEHGRIEVTLSFEDGGPLRAVVAASQPATLDLLRRDSADLSRALGQAGIGTDAQSFSFSAQSQSSGRERQGQAFNPQPAQMHNRAMAPEEIPLPAPDYRPLRTSGRLNLFA